MDCYQGSFLSPRVCCVGEVCVFVEISHIVLFPRGGILYRGSPPQLHSATYFVSRERGRVALRARVHCQLPSVYAVWYHQKLLMKFSVCACMCVCGVARVHTCVKRLCPALCVRESQPSWRALC